MLALLLAAALRAAAVSQTAPADSGAALLTRGISQSLARHRAATAPPSPRPPAPPGAGARLSPRPAPAAGSRLSPCFDQPDLKARVRLPLPAPAAGSVAANGPVAAADPAGDRVTTQFAGTRP